MKINITKATLLEGIQIISSGVSARTTLPILHNFLMETQEGKLRLVRTDMEMATVHFVPAEIVEEGSITVPLKEVNALSTAVNASVVAYSSVTLVSKADILSSTPEINPALADLEIALTSA